MMQLRAPTFVASIKTCVKVGEFKGHTKQRANPISILHNEMAFKNK